SSSKLNVYVSPSSLVSHDLAKPGSTAVPPSSKTSNVSKMFLVTLNVSPSVVRDGSSDVESPPRPKTNVPPSVVSVASSTSASFFVASSVSLASPLVLSDPPPEQAASIITTRKISGKNNLVKLRNFIPQPPI